MPATPSGLLAASRPGVAALVLAGVAALAAGVDGPGAPFALAATAPEGVALDPGTEAAVRTGVLVLAAFEFLRCRALPFLPFSAEPNLGVLVTFAAAGEPPVVPVAAVFVPG